MERVVELTKALYARKAADGPPHDNELNRSSRQPHHPSHLEPKAGKNNLIPSKKEILLKKG